MSDLPGLLSLYSQTAPFYEQQVSPVFAPLAQNLADWVIRCAASHFQYSLYDPFDLDESVSSDARRLVRQMQTVDVGTGTGLLARMLAPHVRGVVGIDLSPAMLSAARKYVSHNIRLLQADVHHSPLRPGSFQLAVSSFGLNATTPKGSLKSLAGLLRRGGMLALQEWSVEDEPSRILDETLKDHEPATAPELDEALSDFYAGPKPWYDQLQDTADYYEMLKQVGFDLVWVREGEFATVHLSSIEPLIQYKMAWPGRRLALEAMTSAERREFDADLRERLRPYLNADGSFDWTPALFRVLATT